MIDPEGHEARVAAMADDDSRWNLSVDDAASIRHVLERMREAESEVVALKAQIEDLKGDLLELRLLSKADIAVRHK